MKTKMIIISPSEEVQVFERGRYAEFHHCLFAVLAGLPKRVSIDFDDDYNEVYRISYID